MTKPRLQVFQLKQPDESDFQKYPDAERFRRLSRQLSWSIDELIVGRMQWQQVIAISAAAKQSIVTYVQGERVASAEKSPLNRTAIIESLQKITPNLNKARLRQIADQYLKSIDFIYISTRLSYSSSLQTRRGPFMAHFGKTQRQAVDWFLSASTRTVDAWSYDWRRPLIHRVLFFKETTTRKYTSNYPHTSVLFELDYEDNLADLDRSVKEFLQLNFSGEAVRLSCPSCRKSYTIEGSYCCIMCWQCANVFRRRFEALNIPMIFIAQEITRREYCILYSMSRLLVLILTVESRAKTGTNGISSLSSELSKHVAVRLHVQSEAGGRVREAWQRRHVSGSGENRLEGPQSGDCETNREIIMTANTAL